MGATGNDALAIATRISHPIMRRIVGAFGDINRAATHFGGQMKQHTLSAAFPSMSAADLKELAADIGANGLHTSITLYQGEVLDGWHRYQACQMVNVTPSMVDYVGDDPVAFVKSANCHRRQLSASQKAAAIVALHDWNPIGNPNWAPGARWTVSAAEMAEEAGVSERTIKQAKVVEAKGTEEQKRAVKDGDLSVKAAVEEITGKTRAKPAKPEFSEDYEKLLAEHNQMIEAVGVLNDELQTLTAFKDSDGVKEMRELREILRVTKRQRDGLMVENTELKKTIKWLQRKAA